MVVVGWKRRDQGLALQDTGTPLSTSSACLRCVRKGKANARIEGCPQRLSCKEGLHDRRHIISQCSAMSASTERTGTRPNK